MTPSPDTRLPLLDGRGIPQLGLGLYKVPDAAAAGAVEVAIAAGYRHLDDAKLYDNEGGTGAGIRASGIDRDELFVTTKVWNADHGFDRTLAAFEASLERLGLEEVDLYLIHWPAPHQNRYVDTWRALIRLHKEGRARSIGVSNFHTHHLERLIGETGVVPVVNQVELHPWLQQTELRAFHALLGIVTEAWSPLARGRAIGDETLKRIGARYGKSEAQVAIRWHLQVGNVAIPKSVTPQRIRENVQVFDFELDADDLAAIAALDVGFRTGRDPDDAD